MRPKKKILLIDADETRRGILAFALQTNGYAVYQAAAIGHARAVTLPAEPEMSLILARWPLSAEEFEQLRKSTEVPCLAVLGNTDGCPEGLPRIVSPTMEDLLNQIILATRRKRGPKHKVNQLTAA